jgi:hypothetical protein
MKRSSIVLTLVLIAALALVVPAAAITNGQPDGTDHPYVGLIVFDVLNSDGVQVPSHRCSASLLTDTVVLTAGHCTDGTVAARIWFDEDVQSNTEYPFSGTTSYDGVPHTNPDFCIGCGNGLPGFALRDVGIVVLTEPVPNSVVSEYAQLPDAGVVDDLRNKAELDNVGYGVQEQIHGGGPPLWAGLRVRLYAPSQMISGNFTHSDEFMRISLNHSQGKGGTCFGDSGGPNLLGGTNTVLAVNSYVTNSNCSGTGYSSRVDIPEVLDWINGF